MFPHANLQLLVVLASKDITPYFTSSKVVLEIPVSNSNQNLAATSDQNVVQPLATSQEQFFALRTMNYSNSILLSTAIVRVKNSQGHQDIFAVNALVVKELTCNLPNFIVSKFDWPHINGLQLADPSFYISRPVDMILGADVFFDLILYGKYLGLKINHLL
ncbi:hypothetical protein TNCV_3961211 [Trichonephila clavipes]|nr:hypothetical protein TNCV_3961211 [Trichonephila clavipes]